MAHLEMPSALGYFADALPSSIRDAVWLTEGYNLELLQWIALIAAIALLVLDRTEYRTDVLIAVLVPYCFLNAPTYLFHFVRGETGHWVAFIALLVRLFLPPHVYTIPAEADLPLTILFAIVLAPDAVAYFRTTPGGILASLIIAVFLAYQHGRVGTHPREAFTDRERLPYTVCIVLLILAPFVMLFLAHF